ncbi:uncharacterized protein DUF418 [Diaminobutyricimonas aerilata]|uniref:Uncharacterized protein DUF418 n=1 Tax=Diaminobutyricimonas aerilata TaxID=1162967 RepID=A0A2M9CLH2_9MICO|nr:DUF418 domain-containing protein [Diaminobutyricimonas aerilata]PJJ72752.1 uncharacterized protein DUF418 [Diaminobutyricimonas aerilata]
MRSGRFRAAPTTFGPDRLPGLDIARALAVLGMFAAHTIARDGAESLVNGRSSVLFATLAGVSLGLMTGGPTPSRGTARFAGAASIAMRGLLLLALGLLLWGLRTDIAVILDYYGVMFLLLLPVLFAPRWVVAIVGAAAAVVGPVAKEAALGAVPEGGSLVLDRLLTGYYPALIWLAYLAAGLIAARSDLRRARTQTVVAVTGLLGMVLGYGGAALLPGVDAEAHSDSTAEVLGSGGLALVVIAILVWLTSPERRALGRAARIVTWPLAATGSMALTVYVAQLLVLAAWIDTRPDRFDVDYPPTLFAALAVGSILFGTVWRATLGAGPLERLFRALTITPFRRTR